MPPMVSVAEVSTAVERSNSLPRNNPDTDSGATRRTARVLPRLSSWSSHTTSVRSGMAGTNESRMRDAVSLTSVSAVAASARADAAFGSLGLVSIADRARCGGVPQRGQVGGHFVVERVDAARCGVVDRRRERRRRGLQPLREFLVDEARGASMRDAQRRRRQLGGGHAGHPVDQFVRLVDHEQLVFGQHRGVGYRVDGQQGVVGDDDIGVARLVAGLLGEAVGAERAAGRRRCIPAPRRSPATTTGRAHPGSARRDRRCRWSTTRR